MSEPARMKLPDRRIHRLQRLEITLPDGNTMKLFLSAGFMPGAVWQGGGLLLECFMRGAGKTGSLLDQLLDDVAVVLSLNFQFGITPARLRSHLAPAREGVEPSFIAAVLDELVKMQVDYLEDLKALPAGATIVPGEPLARAP